MKAVVTCGCGKTDDFCRHAFRVIHPNIPFPDLFSGRVPTEALANQTTSQALASRLRALVSSKQAYAYYVDAPSLDKDPTEMVDLLTGTRVL